MLIGLLAALVAALLYGVAAVMQASASRGLPPIEEGVLRLTRTALTTPVLVASILMLVVGAGLHLVAIGRVPLYLAQAGIAAQLPITALVSAVTLKERLTGRDVLAVASTFLGIALLAADAGESGATQDRPLLIVGLYVATALMLGLGTVAYRGSGRAAGASLGLLAGLGYAVVTLGGRQLAAPYLSWRTLVIAVVVVIAGVCAFWLYSFAMQRISVAAASAPLIIGETLVPALVGVVVLGDGVPSWPAIAAGLVLAMAGAIYLAGFEGRVLDRGRPDGV
ncbi:putative integral membrane protein [Marmoricola endophyticus]|uniref:Integral membrane protein n=1 Tax=Marmoricola endophyticus TaxID=2040280 RepID=A0A917BG45_9ACTN|nr:hypothetical protein [Marmoricola endophyticus]GGF38332.1 putative integral membrane protein [Marmoricola endophyticus]